jgi:N-hydroxyarylamine O-acetyltransferase
MPPAPGIIATMTETPFDGGAYRRRIQFDSPITPTIDTLAQLIERHAAAIPFENIEVLAGRVPPLDRASLQQKLVQRRRGGYCFEQNGLFLAVLKEAGFVVAGLEARVRAGVPADVVTARTHMALRVTLEGEDYLADVGFGGFAPTAPLKLRERTEQHDAIGTYRFIDVESDLLLQCRTHDGWVDCYRIGPSEPQPIDCEMGNWFVATHPKAMLRHNLLVARSTSGGRLTLFNRTLTLRNGAAKPPEESSLGTRAEFADVLRDAFGLQIDDADLDAVMAVLDRQ